MKKTLTVLMMLLLAAMLIVSCNNNPKQEEKVEVGGTIERGTYPTTAGETYAGKPITWKVLAITDGRALVISEKLLTSKAHASTSVSGLAWADSEINKWLNNTSSDGFIAQYGLGDVSMAQVGDVNGKVFLLTKTEAGTYFSDDASRVAYDLSGTASQWWLASINSSKSYYDTVYLEGIFSSSPVHYEQGVRPALWINL